MKSIFFLSAGIVGTLLFLTGCAIGGRNYDLFIFNSRIAYAQEFAALAQAFEVETGFRIKVYTPGAGEDPAVALRLEMRSRNMPSLFSIRGEKDLEEWREAGMAQDLSTLTGEGRALFAAAAPSALKLGGGGASYGIPGRVEGGGYIVDRRLLGDIFGLEDPAPLLEDIRAAGYEDWEALIKTLDRWIKDPSRMRVSLGSRTYALATRKRGLAAKLTGVFAGGGPVRWTGEDRFIDVTLNAIFGSPYEIFAASDREIRSGRNAFIAYARALDLQTSYLAGWEGPARREQAPDRGAGSAEGLFAGNRAVFLLQDSRVLPQIAALNWPQTERLALLPVKMPLRAQDIIRDDGMTVEKLNRSIPVMAPYYLVVNRLAREAEKTLALQFLLWVNHPAGGRRLLIDGFPRIPCYSDPETAGRAGSLGESILTYLERGDIFPDVSLEIPGSWSAHTGGPWFLGSYFTKPGWTEDDYGRIADSAINEWIKQR